MNAVIVPKDRSPSVELKLSTAAHTAEGVHRWCCCSCLPSTCCGWEHLMNAVCVFFNAQHSV